MHLLTRPTLVLTAVLLMMLAGGATLAFAKSKGLVFDGHHLSMHFTMSEGRLVSSTPSFLGANPAEVPFGPRRGQRTLMEEEDLARDLFVNLAESQTRQALIYPVAAPEILTRASKRFDLGAPVGLPADLMSGHQREKLMRLIGVYYHHFKHRFAYNWG